jgi:hypothetical protein
LFSWRPSREHEKAKSLDGPPQTVAAGNIYVDRMTDARLRLGSFMEDPVIKSDYNTCETVGQP